MSDKKYTKGPWAIMNQGASWLIYGPLGERICKMLYPDRHAIREANAQLIAAAPCLLEALEEALKWHKGDKWRDSNGSEQERWRQHNELLESAIATAHGEIK